MKASDRYINHTLNTSSFRRTCRFSTAPRFRQKVDSDTDFRYNIASKQSNRSTSFGVGPRPVMVNSLAAPNPDRYNLADFTKEKGGKSIGQGREKTHFRSLTYQVQKKTELPSPDTYNYGGQQGISFSLRSKLPGQTQRQIKKRVPGPGQYAQIEMNKQGKYYTSKIRNIRSITFGAPQREYLKRNDTGISPASYDVFNSDSLFSQDRVKIMRRNTTKNFGTSNRMHVQDTSKIDIPGPGQYQNFSSFGGTFVPRIS